MSKIKNRMPQTQGGSRVMGVTAKRAGSDEDSEEPMNIDTGHLGTVRE